MHFYRATEKPRDLKAIRDSLTELLWGLSLILARAAKLAVSYIRFVGVKFATGICPRSGNW